MNIIKKINKKYIVLLFVILFLLYAISPATIAVKEENINKEKDYLIVEMYASTDVDFHVIYDSQNRDISYIKDDSRIKNAFLKFGGFKNDYMGNLNKYVIYTNAQDIEYLSVGNVLHINNYNIRILYPVKRDMPNNIYPKGCVLRFEQWFEM